MDERSLSAPQALARFCLLIALLAAPALAPVYASSGGGNGGAPLAPNLNGDNYGDLVVGVPRDEVKTIDMVGAINVIYGDGAMGLSPAGNQYWHHDNTDVDWENPESADYFGDALAVGDFDCDGLNDVAVGVPGQDIDTNAGAGAVHILYGNEATGLSGTGTQTLHLGLTGSTSFGGDRFGSALAAGDFDADGCDDLAVGAPNLDDHTGAVYCFYGTGDGLSTTRFDLWSQVLTNIEDDGEEDDWFGSALATGYFNDDEYADLAIGVPREDIEVGMNTYEDAGAVNVLYGSSAGLTATDDQFWYGSHPDLSSGSGADDEFGTALAAGDFNGDGVDDLAVGVPYQQVFNDGVQDNAGVVQVIYGTPAGLAGADDQTWKQTLHPQDDLEDESELDDNFGFALAACDFNGDGNDDLAIGVPQEGVSGKTYAGAVNVVYGASPLMSNAGDQFLHQSTSLGDGLESYDLFGRALAAGYFDGDSYCDLAVGVPDEHVGEVTNAGAVNVLYGAASGLATKHIHTFDQGTLLEGTLGTSDAFGRTLAAASKEGTTTTITGDTPDPSAMGETVTVGYTVTSDRGTPTGDVTVSDGTSSCTGTVADGACTLTFAAEGEVTLIATYQGNAHFASSVSAGVQHTVVDETVAFNFASYTVDEDAGYVTIAVKLGVPWALPITVHCATSDGTATEGEDYTDSSATLTFNPGTTGQIVDIPILDDDLAEGDETILLTLSNPTNAIVGSPGTATVTIVDDEPPPSGRIVYLPLVLRGD